MPKFLEQDTVIADVLNLLDSAWFSLYLNFYPAGGLLDIVKPDGSKFALRLSDDEVRRMVAPLQQMLRHRRGVVGAVQISCRDRAQSRRSIPEPVVQVRSPPL